VRGSDVLVSTSGLRHTGLFIEFLPFLSLLRAALGGDPLLESLAAPLSIRVVSIPVSLVRKDVHSLTS